MERKLLKQRIYIDTSVGGYFDEEFKEAIMIEI
jgi:hypothetical protein